MRRGPLALALALAPALTLAGCAAGPAADPCAGVAGECFASDGWALHASSWSATDAPRPWALLVHGLNEDRHPFDALAAQLEAAGWRVLSFDSRGHGESVNLGTLPGFRDADFLAMERDLDAAAVHLRAPPRLLVGASLGANEALRYAARADANATLVLLSPGLDYRGLTTQDAAAAHEGRALFTASDEDAYAAQSARSLTTIHRGVDEVRLWSGKGHGSGLLDDETRAFILSWLR